ncbi:MAG: hypothetical protein KDE14_11765 [Rhodobacteraceae bacterium]|nr:hypothetical protein [Paracoccaceae bacterium]
MIELILIPLALAFGTFMMRLPFALTRTGDDWMSEYMVRNQIRRSFNYDLEDATVPSYVGYPVLQYWILSKFRNEIRSKVAMLANAFYDAITCILLFSLAYWWFSLGQEHARAVLSAAAVGLLFVTSPLLLPTTPRLSGIKSRSLGLMFLFAYFVSILAVFQTGDPVFYGAVVVFGIGVLISSQMAIQAMFLFAPVMAAAMWSPIPLYALGAALGVGLAIPKLGVAKILTMRWHHMRWYIRNLRVTVPSGRNKLVDVLSLPKDLFTNFPKALATLLFRNSIFIALLSAPELVFLIVLLAGKLSASDFTQVPILASLPLHEKFALSVLAGGIFAFALTSLRAFLFIGEAERYLEFTQPFMAIAVVSAAGDDIQAWSILAGLVGFRIAICYLNHYYAVSGQYRKAFAPLGENKNVKDILDRLRKIRDEEGEIRVLTLPVKLSFLLSAELGDPRIKFHHLWMIAKSGGQGFEYMERDFPGYLLPRVDLEYFAKNYRIYYFVVEKRGLVPQLVERLANYPCVYQNDAFAILVTIPRSAIEKQRPV